MDYTFNEKKTVGFETMQQWVTEMFQATGMIKEDAELTADNLVTADARGVYSHGVMRVPIYARRLLKKVTNPSAQPQIVNDHAAIAVMDGNNAMGQVVGFHAMKLAIEKARQHGTGFVSVRKSNHYGTSAYFAMMALSEDMIGITGTIGGTNIMAPWGGTERRLGNNPFGVAIPALNRDPIVLDMAQSVVARGKIVMAMKTNTPIPDTWAFDPDGAITTDPVAAYNGTVRPIGDYKGYGLAYITAILSAVLSGAAFGAEVTDLYEEFTQDQNVGHFMQAIDISSFMEPLAFKKNIDDSIDYMKSSNKAQGIDEIYVPGELEARCERKQRGSGIEYPVEIIKELTKLSTDIGVGVMVDF
jgi:LDH2 family malate/lactate/ureidoglycolate dehydrogenase